MVRELPSRDVDRPGCRVHLDELLLAVRLVVVNLVEEDAGRERRFAGVADAIPVAVGLVGIRDDRAVVRVLTDAVFIDVGGGIDAIAGILCQDRPYFAEWVNYRIKGYDYSKIDFMDQGNPSWNNKEYETKEIS